MNSIKRGLLYLRYNAAKTAIWICLLTVLFSAALASFMVYTAAGKQSGKAEATLANGVTLTGVSIDHGQGSHTIITIPGDVANEFVKSKYVRAYNMENILWTHFIGAKSYYRNETPSYSWATKEELDPEREGYGIATTNAEYSTYFTAKGYRLVEGEYITINNYSENKVMVSEEFARSNGFDIGDTFSIEVPDYAYTPHVMGSVEIPEYFGQLVKNSAEVEIIGIFALPDNLYYTDDLSESTHNYYFLPSGFYYDFYSGLNFPDAGFSSVSVYLDSSENIDEFVKDIKSRINIVRVSDHAVENEFGETLYDAEYYISEEKLINYFYDGYVITFDRDWYELIGEPIERIKRIVMVLTLLVLIGSAGIFVIVESISISGRRKQLGILVALGEKKSKILLQIFFEELIPILMAGLIGLFASGWAADQLTNFLMGSAGEDAVAVVETIGETVKTQNPAYTDESVTSLYKHKTNSLHIDSGIKVKLSVSTAIKYAIFIILLLVTTVLLQIKTIYTNKPYRLLLHNL